MKIERGREITKAIAKYREALSETPTQQEVETVEQYYQKQGLLSEKKEIMEMKTAIEKENSRNKKPTQGKREKQKHRHRQKRAGQKHRDGNW